MTPAGTVMMVARRELRARMFTKGSIWSMSIMVLLIVAALVVTSYLMNRDSETEAQPLAVTQESAAAGEQLVAAAGASDELLEVREATSDEEVQQLVQDGDAVAGLGGTPTALELFSGPDTPDTLEPMAQGVVSQATLDQLITDLGGDPQEVQAQVAAAELTVTSVGEAEAWDVGTFVVAMAILGLMFYLIVSTGSTLAIGVVEEKSSRIVEILLATIRPWHLLTGKIIGIGIVGFTQVVTIVAAGLITASATGLIGSVDVPIGSTLIWSLVWMVLGFVLFAVLWAGAASLVSRQEDTGQVTGPLMMLLFIPFYATMFVVVNQPAGAVAQILTYTPFAAPFAVPVRYAYGEIAVWEMALAVGICAVTIIACVLLAGRVYERGVLHTGGRLKLKTALSR